MTAALVSRGWRALGDDKVLLRAGPCDPPEVAALLHTFNLDPSTREWLPAVGDLTRLDRYSNWTEKRRVALASIWPDGGEIRGNPTHLVEIERADQSGVTVTPMPSDDLFGALLRQTVVPSASDAARQILGAVAATAPHLHGLRVRVGDDAYRDPGALDDLVAALTG